MTTVLALDLGTQTGWSLLHNGQVTSGTLSFKNDRYQGGGMRYLRFSRWLDDMHRLLDNTIGEVYFEEVRRHLGVDAAHVYGGFLATLTGWCEREGIPYEGVGVGTIKQHATGKGNAGKQDVIASLQAKGYRPHDDNEADALALLEWVRDQDFPTMNPHSKYTQTCGFSTGKIAPL
jgi:Holliday junction resolvasome RuvABC endonuclease subunit